MLTQNLEESTQDSSFKLQCEDEVKKRGDSGGVACVLSAGTCLPRIKKKTFPIVYSTFS
jgi:hypothetical protein